MFPDFNGKIEHWKTKNLSNEVVVYFFFPTNKYSFEFECDPLTE